MSYLDDKILLIIHAASCFPQSGIVFQYIVLVTLPADFTFNNGKSKQNVLTFCSPVEDKDKLLQYNKSDKVW